MTDSLATVIYQLKVLLLGVSPMIWRRLLVCGDTTIADLHFIVQITMGWSDIHLHRFNIHGKDYGIARIGGIGFSDDFHKVGGYWHNAPKRCIPEITQPSADQAQLYLHLPEPARQLNIVCVMQYVSPWFDAPQDTGRTSSC